METNLWYFHKKSNSVIINHARKKKVKKFQFLQLSDKLLRLIIEIRQERENRR